MASQGASNVGGSRGVIVVVMVVLVVMVMENCGWIGKKRKIMFACSLAAWLRMMVKENTFFQNRL